MRRNIVGALIAAVGLVLLGTASSFAQGMIHHSSQAPTTLTSPSGSPEMDETSPEPSETPEATPTAKATATAEPSETPEMETESDNETMDDMTTTSPAVKPSGELDDHSSTTSGSTTKSDD